MRLTTGGMLRRGEGAQYEPRAPAARLSEPIPDISMTASRALADAGGAAGRRGGSSGQKRLGQRWADRKQLLHLGVSSLDASRTVETRRGGSERLDGSKPCVSVYKADSQHETQARQIRKEGNVWPPAGSTAAENLQWIAAAPSSPAPIARWAGKIGPSLFMTAVERRDQQQKGREAMERLGRQALRVFGMTASERAANDLPVREGLREALAAPSGRFADLLAEGLSEGAEKGDSVTRAHCLGRLGRPAHTALVTGANSAHSSLAHGFRGLTTAGRRSIRDSGAVMDEAFGTLAFVTATLTDETARVATREQVAEFQTRLLFFVRRALIRRGLPPLVLLVAEMHPGRRAMDGALVPHWHGVIKVAHRPFERWTFRKGDWNRAVLAAYRQAFGHSRGHTQRLTMLPQKTGAARYLAKYLGKGSSDVSTHQGRQSGRMVPRQWWTWTGELRAMVAECRLRPPSAFLSWCCRWWRELEDHGDLKRTEAIQIGEEGAIVGRWFLWSSEEALDRAIETWIGEELARLDELRSPAG